MKIRILYCFLLLLINGFSYSQETITEPHIRIELAPEINFNLVNNKVASTGITHESEVGYGITGGVSKITPLKANLDLRMGVGYKFRIYKNHVAEIRFNTTIMNGWDPSEIFESTQLHSISFPIGLIYKINKSTFLDFGINLDFIIIEERKRKVLVLEADPVLANLPAETKNAYISLVFGVTKQFDSLIIGPYLNLGFSGIEIPVILSESSLQFNLGFRIGKKI